MDSLRAAKIGVSGGIVVLWIVIALVLAGPLVGFLSPQVTSKPVGLSVDIGAVSSQLSEAYSSGSNLSSVHYIDIPVVNEWFFTTTTSFTLRILADGALVYSTSTPTLVTPPFSRGHLFLPLQLTPDQLTQMQGKKITLGGTLMLGDPAWLLTVTLNLGEGSA